MLHLTWPGSGGDAKAPVLALVGKGVCFDSGGLDIKNASGMALMKKDMGGAAHALALAGLVMGAGLKVRLHVLVLAFTYVMFPLLGIATQLLVPSVLTPELYLGVVFLCALPSTVQSSIAFTAIARGNVAAALCAANIRGEAK